MTLLRMTLAGMLLSAGAATAQQAPHRLIAEVQAAVERSQPGAEAAFWEEIRRGSTPLVEAMPGDASHQRVTFVFRAPADARNVVVITPLALQSIDSSRLERVPRTDIWYRTYVLPRDARFTYRFGVNDPLIPFERDTTLFTRMQSWVLDPHNPRQVDVGLGISASLLELDSAPGGPTALAAPSPPTGLRPDSLRVEGDWRAAWVYRSTGYNPEMHEDVLVFLDGDGYRNLIHAPALLEQLVRAGRIPPVAAVFLDPSATGRGTEYNCDPAFSAVLTGSVFPWAFREFGRAAQGTRVTVVGYSLGGLAAGCAALHHPAAVRAVIAQSGSFFRGEGEPETLARTIAERAPHPIRWSIDVGIYETAAIPSRDPSMLTANRHLRNVLRARGYAVRYREAPHGHEHVAWAGLLPEAIAWAVRRSP